jgi:septal ring factor EnvC (AmiA/AmiB activator)
MLWTIGIAVGLGLSPAVGAVTAVAPSVSPAQKEMFLKRLEAGEQQLTQLCNSGKLDKKRCEELEADLKSLREEIERGEWKKAQQHHSPWWCKIPGLREICKLIDDLHQIGH